MMVPKKLLLCLAVFCWSLTFFGMEQKKPYPEEFSQQEAKQLQEIMAHIYSDTEEIRLKDMCISAFTNQVVDAKTDIEKLFNDIETKIPMHLQGAVFHSLITKLGIVNDLYKEFYQEADYKAVPAPSIPTFPSGSICSSFMSKQNLIVIMKSGVISKVNQAPAKDETITLPINWPFEKISGPFSWDVSSKQDQIILKTNDDNVYLVDIQKNKFKKLVYLAERVKFCSDNKFVTTHKDRIFIWNVSSTDQPEREIVANKHVWDAALNNQGNEILYVLEDNTVFIYDLYSNSVKQIPLKNLIKPTECCYTFFSKNDDSLIFFIAPYNWSQSKAKVLIKKTLSDEEKLYESTIVPISFDINDMRSIFVKVPFGGNTMHLWDNSQKQLFLINSYSCRNASLNNYSDQMVLIGNNQVFIRDLPDQKLNAMINELGSLDKLENRKKIFNKLKMLITIYHYYRTKQYFVSGDAVYLESNVLDRFKEKSCIRSLLLKIIEGLTI